MYENGLGKTQGLAGLAEAMGISSALSSSPRLSQGGASSRPSTESGLWEDSEALGKGPWGGKGRNEMGRSTG